MSIINQQFPLPLPLPATHQSHCSATQIQKLQKYRNTKMQKYKNTVFVSIDNQQIPLLLLLTAQCTPPPMLNCCPSINTDTNTRSDTSAEERIRTQIQFSFPLLAVAHGCSIVVLQLTFLPGAELSLTFSTMFSILNSTIISTLNFAIFSSLNFGTYLGRPGYIF